MTKVRRLGRGISELMGDNTDYSDYTEKFSDQLTTVSPSELFPGEFQPREIFDEESLFELANSIEANGIIHPIIVRRNVNKPGYEIIAGERRWRAAVIAKLQNIPVIIKDLTDKQCLELSIIENIQRQDLTVIEEAEAYKKLLEQFSYKHEQLATMMGKSRSHITNVIRILSLPDKIRDMVNKKQLSFGHARALINVENSEEIAKKIISDNFTVRDTEELIKNLQSPSRQKSLKKVSKNIDICNLEKSLAESLNLVVKIEESKGRGKVVIKYDNLKSLDLILQKLSREGQFI